MRNRILFSTLLYFVCIGFSTGNHLSRNRTSIRTGHTDHEPVSNDVNTRRSNTEIPGNNVNVNTRRSNAEIQGSANTNGRIESTNRLNNRVTSGVAPDGSSVILTPVQEGAVQSLRTVLQSGQARGTPRLIGFLIPTSDGRTRLRLMPAYLVRGPDGRDTIRLGRARVNQEGMPLNLRTIVAAARRANLLPTNSTRPRTTTRVQNQRGRPSMVVLRPRTSAGATARTTRRRQTQNRATGRRRQTQRRRQQSQQNSGTNVDQVEVTINTNTEAGGTAGTPNASTNQRQRGGPSRTNTIRRGSRGNSIQESTSPRNRNRFLDTVRTLRQNRRRTNNRRLNTVNRSTTNTASSRNTINRSRQGTLSQNVRTNRVPEVTRTSVQEPAAPADPMDLFNTPRTVNLIGNTGSSNSIADAGSTNEQSGDQGRKVSVTINHNTNQGTNNQNNNNPSRDVSLFDNLNVQNNPRFRDFGNLRNQISNQRGQGQRHEPQNIAQIDKMNSNNLHQRQRKLTQNDLRHGRNFNDHHDNSVHSNNIDSHHTPTFVASDPPQSNQRPTISTTHFDINSNLQSQNNMNVRNTMNGRRDINQLQSNTDNFHQTNSHSQTGHSSNNIGQRDLLNDNNLNQFNRNQVSQLSLHDIFPGLQMRNQQNIPTESPIQSNIQDMQIGNHHMTTASPIQTNFHGLQIGNHHMTTASPIQPNFHGHQIGHQQHVPTVSPIQPNDHGLQIGNQQPIPTASPIQPNVHGLQQNIPTPSPIHPISLQDHTNLHTQMNGGLQSTMDINNNNNPNNFNTQNNMVPSSLQGLNTQTSNNMMASSLQGLNTQTDTNIQPISQDTQSLISSNHLQANLNNFLPASTMNQQNLQTLQHNNNMQQNHQSILSGLQSQTNINVNTPVQNLNEPNFPGSAMNQNAIQPLSTLQDNTINLNTPNQQMGETQAIGTNTNPQDSLIPLLQSLLQQTSMPSSTDLNNGVQSNTQLSNGMDTQLSNGINTQLSNGINTQLPNGINTQQLDNHPLHQKTLNNIAPTTNPSSAQQVVNIQMQNALQPHDFGLSGGHEITHNIQNIQPNNAQTNKINSLLGKQNFNQQQSIFNQLSQPQSFLSGQQSFSQFNNIFNQNNRLRNAMQNPTSNQNAINQLANTLPNTFLPQPNNMLQNKNAMNTLPNNMQPSLLNNNFQNTMNTLSNNIQSNTLNNKFQNTMNTLTNNIQPNTMNTLTNTMQSSPLNVQNNVNPNQGLRDLLRQTIQQILMKKNQVNGIQSNNVLGTPGFLGLNTATRSFPNNQLAPSDTADAHTVINNTTNLSQNTMAVSQSNTSITNNQTSQSAMLNINSIVHSAIPTQIPPLNVNTTVPSIHPFDSAVPTQLPQQHIDTNIHLGQAGQLHQTDIHMTTHTFIDITNSTLVPTSETFTSTINMANLNNSMAISLHNNNTISQDGALVGSVALPTHAPYNITLPNPTENIGYANFMGMFNDTGVLNKNVNIDINATITDTMLPAANTSFIHNATDIITVTNMTDVFNVTTVELTTNASMVGISNMTVDVAAPISPSVNSSTPHIEVVNVTVTANKTTTKAPLSISDVLSPNGKFTKSIKKGLGLKSLDRSTLKGLISNVLRDLFKQNFIDPVKGTLKSSLNYTTMLNSVKKVLLKSKDKLLKLKKRVGLSPTKLPDLQPKQTIDLVTKIVKPIVDVTTVKPVTPYITTQPMTIKQPTLEPPTQAQVIIDSIGNQGVITNQNFGQQPGGGVAVWYSRLPSPSSPLLGTDLLSQSHSRQFHVSNPVIQPSGDLSVMSIAAPSSIPVTLPNHGVANTGNMLDISAGTLHNSNPIINQPNHATHLLDHMSHVTESPFNVLAMSTQPSHLIKIASPVDRMSEPGGVPVFMPSSG